MKVLLDNGILSHAEFAQSAAMDKTVMWGDTPITNAIHGFVRKPPEKHQQQIDALFTIGRLIREGHIEPYISQEIWVEKNRGRIRHKQFNALGDCNILKCASPIERSKFRQTIDIRDYFAKGGKKDQKAGIKQGIANQIAFFDWLCSLTPDQVNVIIDNAALIKLTAFEIESLRDIARFQFLCQRSGSKENYPDVFHLWTAERNSLDAFITLDTKLPNLLDRVRAEKIAKIEIGTKVLRPLDLLQALGIHEADPVPMETNRFYNIYET